MQIEINGRTYQTHAGGSSTQSNRLIPISSNKMGEIFELSRGQYVNLQEIVKHGGDIAKARAEMSRRKDFKQSDFEEQQRFIMRLNSFDGYYNIDFETFPDIYILGEWIAQNLPSIGFVEIICNTDEPRVFHAKNNKKFFCQLRIFDLIEDGKYMYEDIQARGLFYINNIDTDFMRKFFEDLAIFLDMNIYIPWDDIETEILDWTFFCSWCIGNKGKKIVFDAEEFGDFSKTCYLDSIPHEQLKVYKSL